MKDKAPVPLALKNKSDIKVLVVAEDHHQRMAFSDTVRGCGFTLIDCVSRAQLHDKFERYETPIDIWLIDSDYDDSVATATAMSQSIGVLVGFSQAPYLNEAKQYAKWQRKLKRKLAQMLLLPALVDTKAYQSDTNDWQYVVFLGASMGGPSAVKEFLDNQSAPEGEKIQIPIDSSDNNDLEETEESGELTEE